MKRMMGLAWAICLGWAAVASGIGAGQGKMPSRDEVTAAVAKLGSADAATSAAAEVAIVQMPAEALGMIEAAAAREDLSPDSRTRIGKLLERIRPRAARAGWVKQWNEEARRDDHETITAVYDKFGRKD